MFNEIKIFTNDDLWRAILSELGWAIATNPKYADVNFDSLTLLLPILVPELTGAILNEADSNWKNVLLKVFSETKPLSRLQMQIIILLYQTKKISAVDLKSVLGFSPDSSTHTIDNAIYQLRKEFGTDFIKNENGMYALGRL